MISVIVISYNSQADLGNCLQSVFSQLQDEDQVIVIDNASSDGSQDLVRNSFPGAELHQLSDNTGYAFAANRGIEQAQGDFILIINPDAVLGPGFLDEAVSTMDRHPGAAGVTGMTYQSTDVTAGDAQVIDTVGFAVSRGRQFLDMGAAASDCGQFAAEAEVFGISGHCALFRRSALEDAAIDGECFDEDFFMYKEDNDLCWRLRILGWTFRYAPAAIAYHRRGTGIVPRRSLVQMMRARRTLNPMQQYYSFRNHRLMLLKNEYWGTFLPDCLFIVVREIASLCWLLILEPRNARAIVDTMRMAPRILRKRRNLMRRRRASARALRPWLRGRWGPEKRA